MKSSEFSHYGVIAGATGYLGSRLARAFAKDGYEIILVGRHEQKLEILKRELQENLSTKAFCVESDFSEENFMSDFEEQMNKLDADPVFFINASGSQKPINQILNISDASWRNSLQINLVSAINLSKYFATRFLKSNGGSIILLSGGGSTSSRPNFGPYSVAKTGLVRFVENFAAELSNTQVRINAVSPGIMPSSMMTEVIESGPAAGKAELAKAQSAVAKVDHDDSKVVELCRFLISNDSLGLSGKLISAEWDNWRDWPNHLASLQNSDLYTLRRIVARDRGQTWGDL